MIKTERSSHHQFQTESPHSNYNCQNNNSWVKQIY